MLTVENSTQCDLCGSQCSANFIRLVVTFARERRLLKRSDPNALLTFFGGAGADPMSFDAVHRKCRSSILKFLMGWCAEWWRPIELLSKREPNVSPMQVSNPPEVMDVLASLPDVRTNVLASSGF